MALIRCTISLILLVLICETSALEISSQQYVAKSCNQKLEDIDSIAKFKEFMNHYRVFISDNATSKRGPLNLEKRVSKCLKLKDALYELEQIIESRNGGVCNMNYINKLIDFKVKHILKIENGSDYKNIDKIDSKSSYVAFFFTVYAYQITYHCKSQLPAKLEVAQQSEDCSAILGELAPDSLEHDSANGQDDEMKLAATLLSESRVESFVPILHLKHLNLPVANIDVIVPNSAASRIEALQKECKKIEPFYTASLSPLGALAQFGYEVDSNMLDNEEIYRKFEDRIKCWLGAAQLCQGILRTHLRVSDNVEVDPDLDSKLVTVELEGSPSDVPSENFETVGDSFKEASFDEVSPAAVKLTKKRLTFTSKMKWRVSNSIKNFIERRIDIKATQENALRGMLDSVKSMDNDIDKKVSFGGKEIRSKAFNPSSVITDQADSIIRTSSPFFNKEIGFFMSCIVGVVMTAVFIYLSVYMAASIVKHRHFTADGNSKGDWRKLRDEKVAKVKQDLTAGKRNIFGMHVYRPQY